jgi:hypothetical protein
MAARLSRLIALALLALPADVRAQALVGASQVIDGDALRRAGATRLSDVLALAARWDVETTDGFRWIASPLGGAPLQSARWTVLVDGHRMDDDLFGLSNLDRLGVPLEQVASVELVELPRLTAGGLTTDGLIHIHTAEPVRGPSAGGSFVTGSEIGDPGPFAFTPAATSNVDRLGHTATAEMSYAGEGWFASAAVAWARLVPTDPELLDRYRAALGPVPRLRSTAPSLRVGGHLAGGRHELVLRHSQVDGALALSPFGTELATDEAFTFAGLAGELAAGEGRRLIYDVSHTRNSARLRGGRPGPPLDWRAGVTDARIEVAGAGAALETAGVRLRRRAVRRPARVADPEVTLATGYTTVRLGRGPAPRASGTITIGDGDVGYAALLAQRWRVDGGAALEAILSYERLSRGEDNTIWAWTERGYGLLEEGGADFSVVGGAASPKRAGADLALATRPARGIAISARALLRRSRGLSLERRELHYRPAISSFEGPATLVRDVGGELAGGSVEIAVRPAPRLGIRASYWARAVLGGDRLFRDAWAAMPSHGARATAELLPVPGLELWLATTFRGAARHSELAQVEVESAGRYRARAEGAVTLDAALQKRLWDGRLRAHVGIRNLLGADRRYHPAGAIFGPTAIVQLEAMLP